MPNALLDIPNALAAGQTNWGQVAGQNIQRNRLYADQQAREDAATQRKLTAEQFNALDDRVTQALASTQSDEEAAVLWPKLDAYATQVLGSSPEALAVYRQHFTPEYNPIYRQMAIKPPTPAEPFTLGEGQVRFGPNGQQVAAGPAKTQTPTDLMRNLADPEARKYLEAEAARKAQMGDGGGASPYFQFLPGADGYLVGNARTGQIAPGMVGGQRAIPGALDPTLQGQLVTAKEGAKADVDRDTAKTERVRNATDSVSLIQEAQKLLPSATGSLGGSLVDKAAGAVGISTSGAKSTARLNVIGGLLTSKVPRMEGPQSNYDVQLYQQMAGDLANPNLPAETRGAAAEIMLGLNKKYAHLNGPDPAQPAGPREGATATNPQTGQRIVFRGGQWVPQ